MVQLLATTIITLKDATASTVIAWTMTTSQSSSSPRSSSLQRIRRAMECTTQALQQSNVTAVYTALDLWDQALDDNEQYGEY